MSHEIVSSQQVEEDVDRILARKGIVFCDPDTRVAMREGVREAYQKRQTALAKAERLTPTILADIEMAAAVRSGKDIKDVVGGVVDRLVIG